MVARPRHRESDLVGKCGEEHFIVWIQPLNEQLERAPRVGPPCIVEGAGLRVGCHAAADVEEDSETDRHTLGGKLQHRTARAAVDDLEFLRRQVADETPGAIRDGDRYDDEIGFGAKDGSALRVKRRRKNEKG